MSWEVEKEKTNLSPDLLKEVVNAMYEEFKRIVQKEKKLEAVTTALKMLGFGDDEIVKGWDEASATATAEASLDAHDRGLADKVAEIMTYVFRGGVCVESINIMASTDGSLAGDNENLPVLGDVVIYRESDGNRLNFSVYKKIAEPEINGVKTYLFIVIEGYFD